MMGTEYESGTSLFKATSAQQRTFVCPLSACGRRAALLLGMLVGFSTGRAQTSAAILPLDSSAEKSYEAQKAPDKGFGGLFDLDRDWSLHAQSTIIEQAHPGFHALYDGPQSMAHTRQSERTFSFSLFVDRRLWAGADLVFNPEMFQGHGLSDTFGVAGFPNGEAVKSGFANFHYNTSRLFIRQVIGLGGETEKIDDDLDQVAGEVNVNRLTFSIGKFSAGDFFDVNAYSHDPRTQFLNWSLWESEAWDYPADVVGFTAGFVAEWNTRKTTLHYGIFMEPQISNGVHLDKHIGKAYGQVLQFDYRYQLGERSGTVRPFVFFNRAHMGSYSEAVASGARPADVTLTRRYRSKAGFGLSWDQGLTADLGGFARLSWNDGHNETWAFAEVDRSIAFGLTLKGPRWSRANDTIGLAGAINGISRDHRRYLAAGGTGLILGDGALNYAPEQIIEIYYDFVVFKWLHLAPDYQYIRSPGYNSDRGPISFYAIRAHAQF